jgi:hypothetical protein
MGGHFQELRNEVFYLIGCSQSQDADEGRLVYVKPQL